MDLNLTNVRLKNKYPRKLEKADMENYWKNHYDENARKFSDSPLRQVDRTVQGAELSETQMSLTIEAVKSALKLCEGDRVADLCCGNGIITNAIAKDVHSVLAVDFSEGLIAHATNCAARLNIHYVVADVTELEPSFFNSINKIYIRDSVSCMSSAALSKLLHNLVKTVSVDAIYIAGIPDADKLGTYYDNDEKMRYYRDGEKSGKPHIGAWWSRQQMKFLINNSGWSADFIPQDIALASAFYRYDCLIKRP